MEQKRGLVKYVALGAAALMFGLYTPKANAVEFEFHGYVENASVLRDTDGYESGFMDQAEMIQWRTTLKFDVDAYIKMEMGDFALDKVHLTYRGAYDAIFDLRPDEYGDIPDKYGEKRFQTGLDDIKWENDLREISADITYRGAAGSGFFRPGRQLVSWGEVSGITILDRLNPSDASLTRSAFPDEVKIPIFMGRLNYSIPPQEAFNLNFDFVVIPDIVPTKFAPVDGSAQAPFLKDTDFRGLAAAVGNGAGGPGAFVPGATIEEDVPSHRTEYAAKMTMDIGANLSISGVFESIMDDNPGLVIDVGPGFSFTGVRLTHQWTHVWGGSFNYYVEPPLDIVVYGEYAYVDDEAAKGATVLKGATLERFNVVDEYSWGLGVSKNLWMRWLCPTKMVSHTFQWLSLHYKGLEQSNPAGPTIYQQRDALNPMNTYFTYQIQLSYIHGKVDPSAFFVYDTMGVWLFSPGVNFNLSKHWKANLSSLFVMGNEHSRSANARRMYQDADHDVTYPGQSPAPHDAIDQLQLKVTYQW